jgi:nitric oxide reductase large subunit
MTQNFVSWMWMLAVFPLWIVMAWLWFSLALLPKKTAGPRMRKLIDAMAVSLSMFSAMGVLVGLNCGSLISLPFADQACHASAVPLTAWVRL